MFQLIVAVISIALVAALAIASIFYGGDAFTKSSERANVTTLINQAQQIAGAAALYKTDNGVDAPGGAVADGHALVGDYLSQAPNGGKISTGAWTIVGDAVRIELVEGACAGSVGEEIANQLAAENCETDGADYFRFAL